MEALGFRARLSSQLPFVPMLANTGKRHKGAYPQPGYYLHTETIQMKADSMRTRREFSFWGSLVGRLLPAMLVLTAASAAFGQGAMTMPAAADANASTTADTAEAVPEVSTPDATPAPAAATTTAQADDEPAYLVSKFVLRYGQEHAQQPGIAPFANLPITLGRTAQGYTAPTPGTALETIRLGSFSPAEPRKFTVGALRRILEAIVEAYNRQGLVGVWTMPSEDDIDQRSGEDKRPDGDTTLDIVVWAGTVSQVRTLASGERIAKEQRVDNPAHDRIRERSPITTGSLLDKKTLDEYVYLLNRQPGRRVDVAISSGKRRNEVALDYLVSENRPWLAYVQTSNTGTEATNEWRTRFGFVSNQLTGNDDVLSVEYTTACLFDPAAQSVAVSYEAPLCKADRLRWRGYGNWARYEATVDTPQAGENFNGHEWRGGAELLWNICQKRALFVDLIGGAYWWHVYVDNETAGTEGDADFFVPYVGLRLERITDLSTTIGQITLESNCEDLGGSNSRELEPLGRQPVDSEWLVMKWDAVHSFYLEPLVNPSAWRDVNTPETSTLAHEIYLHLRGQWDMNGYRLIPQNQYTAGGFFSVRGYPESAVAGDSAVIGTAEYKLHLPRLMKVQPDPTRTPLPLTGTPFRWAPQSVYGRPDWDLIARAFFDIGSVSSTFRQSAFEQDHTLMGAGVGLELQFSRHVNLRLDCGLPLRDLNTSTQTVDACSECRLHFVATVIY